MNYLSSIEDYAEEIHSILKLEKNFNIENLIQKLGGKIEFSKLKIGILSEILILKEENTFKIIVSEEDSKIIEKKFSIAKNLGTLFIHLDFLKKDDWIDKFKNKDTDIGLGRGRKEIESKVFAYSFLMPKKLFISSVCKNTKNQVCDIEKVAKEFNISYSLAYNRGLNIGIWK